MRFLDWLFGKAPTIVTAVTEPPPEIVLRRTQAPPPPTADMDMEPVEAPDSQPLENLYCFIEYRDAAGAFTRRPVTLISLTQRKNGLCITAVCHLRRALRTFRADRIEAMITADGEVFDGTTLLTDLFGIDTRDRPAKAAPRAPDRAPPIVSRDFREIILPPLTVLVACGKCDGNWHRDEIDRIMSWAESESFALRREGRVDVTMTIEEADAFGKIIAGMRPQRRTLRQHMLETLNLPPEALARFRRALIRVIEADGQLHGDEISFIRDFDELAGIAKSDIGHLAETIGRAAAE